MMELTAQDAAGSGFCYARTESAVARNATSIPMQASIQNMMKIQVTDKAIEAGARAIAPYMHDDYWKVGNRTIAKACIEAAIASGALVPAAQLAAISSHELRTLARLAWNNWPDNEQSRAITGEE